MATVQNITIDQGTTFSLTINLTNDDNSAKNLANYTIASQMRKSYEGTTKTDFTTAKVDATGEVTKITVETASNVVGAVSEGVVKAVSSKARAKKNEEE